MWEQINLCCKKVPAAFIQKVLDNGCRYLSLANSRVKGRLDLTKEIYPVKYLDLSNCDTSEDYSNDNVLEELVGSCYSLQKLSLSKLTLGLHSNMVQNIVQNGFTLKVRPLSGPPRVSQSGVELEIFFECDFMASEDAYGSYKTYGKVRLKFRPP